MSIMSYAPGLQCSGCYHIIVHFPWIVDTLVMLGLSEVDEWGDIDHLDCLIWKLMGTTAVRKSRVASDFHPPLHHPISLIYHA
eukprot:554028-Ditylum_brightwellii.AAC.1